MPLKRTTWLWSSRQSTAVSGEPRGLRRRAVELMTAETPPPIGGFVRAVRRSYPREVGGESLDGAAGDGRGGRRSRVSKPQPGGQGQGPASDRLPASLRPSVSSRKSLRVPSPESRGGRGAVPSVESRPIFRAARRDSVRDFCPNGPGRRVRPSIPHAGEPIPAGQQVLTRRASRTSARTGWSSDLWSNGYFRHLSTTPQSLFRLR